jgi:outer membrane protein OmpA-like peptidoglycan-associated protein
MNKGKLTLKLAVVAAALAAAGCALSPVAEKQLTQARAAYRVAADDPQVQRYAQVELTSAANALADAERMAQEGKDSALVEHNAYLAEQRARTALGAAQAREAEASIAAAREERRRAMIEAREREAAAAREAAQRAEIARREAEARARVLEDEKLKLVEEKSAAAELATEVRRLVAEVPEVQAKQTERGWILTLGAEQLFDAGATLKPGAQRPLDNLAEFLRKHPERGIAIEGFTDSLGPKDASERLSERRAQALKFALVQRGIEPHLIDARGYGASFPVASNATETGRQQNRRVEIVLSPS